MVKISVIVPVYNIENYIAECIDSILKQSFTEFEMILVDDGSTDKSGNICEEYREIDNRVIVIHQKNGGLSDARNTGIKKSKGNYIYFVDGDDFIHKDALINFINVLKDNPNSDFIIGRMSYFVNGSYVMKPDELVISNDIVKNKDGEQAFVSILSKHGVIRMGVRGLYNRVFLFSNDLFFKKGLYSEDQEWTVKLFIKAKKIASNTSPDYYYRASRMGSLVNTLSVKKAIDLIDIYEGWIKYLTNNKVSYSFRETLLREAGSRYIGMFYKFSYALTKNELETFYQNIERTKYIFKYSQNRKHKIVRYMVKFFGVKFTSMIFRIGK